MKILKENKEQQYSVYQDIEGFTEKQFTGTREECEKWKEVADKEQEELYGDEYPEFYIRKDDLDEGYFYGDGRPYEPDKYYAIYSSDGENGMSEDDCYPIDMINCYDSEIEKIVNDMNKGSWKSHVFYTYSEITPEQYREWMDNMDWDEYYNNSINEDTVKQNGKWVNKGKEGTHGTFKTKKAADAQRKAMFAGGYKESLEENYDDSYLMTIGDLIEGSIGNLSDDEINRDIKLYNSIGRVFGHKNPDDIIVFVDTTGEYDPEYFSQAMLDKNKNNFDVFIYQDGDAFNDVKLCINRLNGNNYLFFESPEDAKTYIDAVDNQYEGFEEDDSF